MQPDTRYARSGDVNIAYQVLGEGPRDLVYVPGWVSNIDVYWEGPELARFLTTWSVDRLGRSLQDLVGFLTEVHALGINLFLHQQGIDTTTQPVRPYSR
jgi:Resolvase, N terminal domain